MFSACRGLCGRCFVSWNPPEGVAVVVPVLLLMKRGIEVKSLAHSRTASEQPAPVVWPELSRPVLQGCSRLGTGYSPRLFPNEKSEHDRSFALLQHCIANAALCVINCRIVFNRSWQECEFLISLLFAHCSCSYFHISGWYISTYFYPFCLPWLSYLAWIIWKDKLLLPW